MAKKKTNGTPGAVRKHESTKAARERVLRKAREQGIISSDQARKIGKWDQAWYHLNALCKDGLLKHAGYNLWSPVKRRGRPRLAA